MSNSLTVNTSCSFKNFYLDETLTGHIFLEPSIFVGQSCTWIFSPIEDKGCDAFIEVVSRALLLVALPIIAIVAAFLIPVGLICKSITGLCSATTPANTHMPELNVHQLPRDNLPPSHQRSTHTPDIAQTPNANPMLHVEPSQIPLDPPPFLEQLEPVADTQQTHTSSSDTSSNPNPPLPTPNETSDPSYYTSSELSPPELPIVEHDQNINSEKNAVASSLLEETESVLEEIGESIEGYDAKNLDIKKREILQAAADRLDNNTTLKQFFLLLQTDKHNDSDPVNQLTNRWSYLKDKIDRLISYYDYHKRIITLEGVVPVSDDGNCLFTSFIGHLSHNQRPEDVDKKAALEARHNAVNWMRRNYETDRQLQNRLPGSLIEHYERLIQNAENDIEHYRNESQTNPNQSQRQQAKETLLQLEEALPSLLEALEKISLFGPFETIQQYVPSYLDEMSKEGVFGGFAELYALSMYYQVGVQVYIKTTNGFEGLSEYLFGKEFTREKHLIHLLCQNKHYSMYYPQDDQSGRPSSQSNHGTEDQVPEEPELSGHMGQ